MKFQSQSGIAIGPILLLIAILAILGAAIAASNGFFTSGTSTENANTIAESIIVQADAVSTAVQTVMNGNFCTDSEINFYNGIDGTNANSNAPSNHTCDIYQPAGGGLLQFEFPNAVPANSTYTGASVGLTADILYPTEHNAIADVGTSASDLVLAMYNVSLSICTEINRLVNFNEPTFTPPSNSIWMEKQFTGTFPSGSSVNFGGSFTQGCYRDAQYGGSYNYVRVLEAR
jgi:hypothetical protein